MGWATGYQKSKANYELKEARLATQDIAERRMKLLENQFSAAERDRALQWMSQYSEANNKRNVGAKEKAKMKAKLLSMSPALGGTTADYIIGSGEAPGMIKVYDKRVLDGTLSKTWIKSVVKHVESILGDEKSPQAVTLALQTALLSGEDQSKEDGQYAALQQISFNILESGIVPGDFNENVARAIAGLNLPNPTIALTPIGNLTSGSQEISSDQTNKITAQYKDAITVHVGQIFSRDDVGMPFGSIDATKIKGPVDPIDIQELLETSIQDTINKLQRYSGNLNDSEIIQQGKLAAMEAASALQKKAQEKIGGGGNIAVTPEDGINNAMGGGVKRLNLLEEFNPYDSTVEERVGE